jgi:hypothetical protein
MKQATSFTAVEVHGASKPGTICRSVTALSQADRGCQVLLSSAYCSIFSDSHVIIGVFCEVRAKYLKLFIALNGHFLFPKSDCSGKAQKQLY